MRQYTIKTFYSFTPQDISSLEESRKSLEEQAAQYDVIGLVILGKEGFNTTLAALNEENLNAFVKGLKNTLTIKETSLIKTSFSEKRPFRRFDVKIRPEIVTFEREDFIPQGDYYHLSPREWNEMMKRDDVVVIDTRNTYETKIGKFKKALDLEIEEFTEFADKLRALDSDREKPHLIYCTGGIRCEKAIYELEAQGFKNIYQLEGGILNYLEQFPNDEFDGECFVFDSRVSVDQNLRPSQKFSLCPHCGDVASIDITCLKCDSDAKLCEKCHTILEEQKDLQTCSKNCRHHYKLRPHTKGPQQKLYYHE